LFFNLILQGLKYKIKRLGIYFDEKYDMSTCAKTRDYDVLLPFYSYYQDKDSYPLLNLILNQIQISKKKMSLFEIFFFFIRDENLAL
jgi:hypothetical protein